jgi:hypothetical protein
LTLAQDTNSKHSGTTTSKRYSINPETYREIVP